MACMYGTLSADIYLWHVCVVFCQLLFMACVCGVLSADIYLWHVCVVFCQLIFIYGMCVWCFVS